MTASVSAACVAEHTLTIRGAGKHWRPHRLQLMQQSESSQSTRRLLQQTTRLVSVCSWWLQVGKGSLTEALWLSRHRRRPSKRPQVSSSSKPPKLRRRLLSWPRRATSRLQMLRACRGSSGACSRPMTSSALLLSSFCRYSRAAIPASRQDSATKTQHHDSQPVCRKSRQR